jgi:hypothetical protein
MEGNMYLLQAAVTMDVARMPFAHLIAVLSFCAAAVTVVFINGFSLRLGEREINIGGIRRLLARKDEDTLLKEELKRFADDTDRETSADLLDLIEDLDAKIEALALSEHCYFTFEKFIAIFKRALEKRVWRNNLKEKLAGTSREKYAAALLREIEEKHELMYAKIALVKCGDSYRQFSAIKEKARELLGFFFADAVKILAAACRKKIAKYNEAKPRFKTQAARKFCCDDCIEKNKRYIEKLTGEAAL